MSYEGYEQCLCEDGHYYTRDCWDEEARCSCGKEAAWSNPVDDTNGEGYGYVPYPRLLDRFLLVEGEEETCSLGCVHVVRLPTFRVPTVDETRALREETQP